MWSMIMAVGAVAVGALAVMVAAGCGGSPYYLPPPDQHKAAEAVNPAEQAERDQDSYLAARQALLELYQELSNERYEAAERYLSQQTRDFLAYGSETGDPSAVLASGQLALPDGRSVEINPVDFLIGGEVAQISDTQQGTKEHETRRRRELFVQDTTGQTHPVIMIRQGNQWVLQKTAVQRESQ